MQVIRITHPNPRPESVRYPSQVMAIGDFDGVHLGHHEVIRRAAQRAEELQVQASVMTFHPHPRKALGQEKYQHTLTPLQTKMNLLASLGVHHTYAVHFDKMFSEVTPERFVEDLIIPLGVGTIIVGFDFRFGFRGEGTPDLLCELGKGRFAVEVVRPYVLHGEKVSSTFIRECLESSRMEEANRLLGRNYSIHGKVVQGDQRGRTLGFPTANIEPSEPYVVPGAGVYVVKADVDGIVYDGIANIGIRPTFDLINPQTSLEVHIFGFNQSIYHRNVVVSFISFIRHERKFSSVDELIAQISADIAQSKEILANSK